MRITAVIISLLFIALPCAAGERELFSPGGIALISADAAAIALAAAAIAQQNSLAEDYDLLRSKTDNTTEAGYYRLLYEKEKVESAGDLALIAGCAAGGLLAYTALDYFFFGNVFKETASFEIRSEKEFAGAMIKRRF